jgi:ABC-type bacteriocin/lantibiotic exporter with double-glycine peptidase domain
MKTIFKIFKSIGKDNFFKSVKILLILVGIILLEFLGIYLIVPIVSLFMGNENKVIDYFSDYVFFNKNIGNFELAQLILILFLILTVFRICLYFYFDRKTVQYARSIEKTITLDIYKFIYSKSWKEILKNDNSSFVSSLLSDVPIFVSMGVLMSISVAKDILILSFTVIFVLFVNELYLLNLIVIFVFLSIAFSFLFKKKIKQYSLKYQNIIKLKFQCINEGILGLKDLKLSHNKNKIIESINNIENEITKISIFHRALRVFPRLFLELFIILFICSLFFFHFEDRADLINKIPSLTLLVFLTFRLLPFFSGINSNLQSIKQHSSQIEHVIDSLETLEEHKKSYRDNFIKTDEDFDFNKNTSDKLVIKNLFFKYDNDFIIKNLNLEVNSGNIIGIFGKSGSGKSTLLDLMLGLLKPNNGEIFYNKNNINLVPKSWNKLIGYISQSIFLFNDSIRNNIILEKSGEFNNVQLDNLIKKIELNTFISALPNGLDTKVGDLGKNLSGGQKQKIAFARVLYKNPNLIFLDEATNSIDEKTEDVILDYLNLIKKNKIIILITHSTRLFKYCDLLFELKDGELKLI